MAKLEMAKRYNQRHRA
ncbi:hypothetical protein AYI69_g7984, partial [Smittium culicis]